MARKEETLLTNKITNLCDELGKADQQGEITDELTDKLQKTLEAHAHMRARQTPSTHKILKTLQDRNNKDKSVPH